MGTKSSLIIVLFLLASTGLAVERLVPGEYAGIQEAIDAAGDGDVVIVDPGTYLETINFKGKAITVRSARPDSWEAVQGTVILAGEGAMPYRMPGSAGGSCVVFEQGEGANSVLEGLTLTGGANQAGGGVRCENSSPTIRRCNIVGNTADAGGGIALIGTCRALISGCLITNNTAGVIAGGIMLRQDLSDVPGSSPRPRRGPGGTVSVSSGLSHDPTEQAGSVIVNCTIADNSTEGVYPYEVDCWDTQPRILNTIIYGPDPSLLIADASLVSHCCIREVHIFQGDYMGSAEPFDIGGMAGNISKAPRLVGLYLGPDEVDYHLLPGSPCIDAGDGGAVLGEPMDIDGQARVMGGVVDIGADEMAPQLVVTRPAGGEIWAGGSTHEIQWDSLVFQGDVDLLLSLDGGDAWQTIAGAVPDTGTFAWRLDAVDSNQCVIQVVPSQPDPNVLQISSAPFTIRPDSVGANVDSKWLSLGGDFRRSGLAQDAGPTAPCKKWTFETGAAVVSSVTVGSDNRIHVACEDGILYTLAADGAVLWTLSVNAALESAPTIGPDGSLFVGSEDGRLYAVDPGGSLRWTCSTGGPVYSSPAVASTGDVYVGSTDGTLYALGPDGTELWRFRTKGPGTLPNSSIFASPAVGADGTVYVAGLYDPNLYALDPSDGSVKWVCNFELYPEYPEFPASPKVGGWVFTSPVIAADGTIYQTLLYDRHLHAIDPDDGLILWSTDLLDPASGWFDAADIEQYDGADGWSEPALGPDGTIYVSLDDPYLRAVDPSGAIKWATRLGEVGAFTLTVDKDGLVYAASDDGCVYVVDPTGLEITRFETGGWPVYPVIAAADMLVIADSKDYSTLNTDAKSTVWAISSDCLEGWEPAVLSR